MIKVVRTSLMVLILACTAHAGWMPNGEPEPPPPPPPTNTAQEPEGADIPYSESETITQIASTLLQSVLSLL